MKIFIEFGFVCSRDGKVISSGYLRKPMNFPVPPNIGDQIAFEEHEISDGIYSEILVLKVCERCFVETKKGLRVEISLSNAPNEMEIIDFQEEDKVVENFLSKGWEVTWDNPRL